VRAQVLVRIKSERVFYDDPRPRRAPTKGRPPRHGRRFKLSDTRSAPTPDAQIQLEDRRYRDGPGPGLAPATPGDPRPPSCGAA
jgi:hypothetical protein